ncbi:unnamed protein product, partial [marine sediment metagenome]
KHQSPNDNLIVNYDNEETVKIKKETRLPIYWFSTKK